MEKLSEDTKSSHRSDESISGEFKCEEETNDSDNLDSCDALLCTDCDERFWDETELFEHKTRHSMGLICSICGYEAVGQSNMISHSRSHLDRESVQCVICKERLADEERLELHITEHVWTLSKCPWCPYISLITSELKRHIDQHLKKLRINCNFCKYYSFCKEDLRAHSELHSNDTFKPKFKQRRKLTPDNKPSEPTKQISLSDLLQRAIFRCGLCGLQLPGEEAFEAHLTEHVLPGIAYCPHCNYQTDEKENIMKHVLDHIEVRPGSVISGETMGVTE